MSVLKVCTRCKEEKPIDAFHRNTVRNGKVKYQARCKSCRKETRPKQSDAEKAAMRRRNYMNFYGITPEQYDEMMVAQDYRCAICRQHQDEFVRAFAVDHDHKTGAVRGLLCRGCNTGIGNLADDPDRVFAAWAYLNQVVQL